MANALCSLCLVCRVPCCLTYAQPLILGTVGCSGTDKSTASRCGRRCVKVPKGRKAKKAVEAGGGGELGNSSGNAPAEAEDETAGSM